MKRIVMLSMAFALCSTVATAQPGQQGGRPGQGQGLQQGRGGGGPGGGGVRGGGGGGSRPGSAGSSALERAGLKLGQALPDLNIFDENGKKFSLKSIKGKHTVVVFGCMT